MTYPKVDFLPDQTTADHAARVGVVASPKFPEIEERILKYWDEDGTFMASVEARDAGENGENEFVFYDGPPFANGLPHYGHLLTGYVKDLIPRYQTMRGHRVERRFGWDTHGLPAELEAQRVLGLKTKGEILELGIEEFNAACRESVLKYTDDWQAYVHRQGRWVDFEHDYKTLNPDYMESVMWAFKTLYDKGLVYEGYRVLPYCWNDETPLSNHELRMDDDVYQMRQDPAVTVGYRLDSGELALIWTTTPWTLVSNLAMAVNTDVDYVVVEGDVNGGTERYLLAEARVAAYSRELGEDASERIVQRLKGFELLGRHYTPPFSYFVGHTNAHQVLAADYVTIEDGTGIVHIAPAFGEEDKVVTDAADIEPVVPVGPDGKFTAPVVDYEGMLVFDANLQIIDHLKARTEGRTEDGAAGSTTPGTVLLRRETYDHSYPHCWRCRQPLIYMAVSSWFVEVTKVRDRMVELNEQITWVPEHVKHGQFGKWLSNARDWSISRNRFWGSPIPVWQSDDPTYPRTDVYGSFEELQRDFGTTVTDLHRPFIDRLTRPNPDDPTGRSTMRRVPDVLDVWFDSGSMSFAQVHYPFENAQWFENHFPGDFIVEYIGQTRGWFYTMHVLATALFDRPAFSSCVSHGIVLGNDGLKMSKSLGNYPSVSEVFDRDGADAMRWFLMSSSILRGGNLIVTEQGIRDGVRQVLLPLWSSWYFFSLYANAAQGGAGYEAKWSTASEDVLDRYLLAKLRRFVEEVQQLLDTYDVASACESVRGFLDVLSNWYIRRSRDRFWDGESASSTEAFDTLYTTLEVITRVAAPLLPFTTEEIWRGLTGARSVHLTDWPDSTDLPADDELVDAMDRAREICSVASGLRKAGGLRNRLPLQDLTVVTDDAAALDNFAAIVADEINVRTVTLVELGSASESDFGVSRKLTVNARAAGPRLGKNVQLAIKGSKSGDWSVSEDGTVVAGGLALVEGEYSLEAVVGEANSIEGVVAERAANAPEGPSRVTAMLPRDGFVVLDTTVTPELAAEGLARDVIRAVQQARRDAGLDVSDRISLTVSGDDEVWAATVAHQQLIMLETLAMQFGSAGSAHPLPEGQGVDAVVGENQPIRILVKKI
ncbi:MAG: isoleucine--tRNA ligase [Phycicoccus sp.]|nr:isoleucine--tRNA ligase [Phycicoccus sp.]